MKSPEPNKRRFERYEMDLKIQFYVNFDLETKIAFYVKEKQKEAFSNERHDAISRNVSVEGICFKSKTQLSRKDILLIYVYLPKSTDPIRMEGEVRWSQPTDIAGEFSTGVQVCSVNEEPVSDSIFLDTNHNIAWSNVLETVFGNFKNIGRHRKDDE